MKKTNKIVILISDTIWKVLITMFTLFMSGKIATEHGIRVPNSEWIVIILIVTMTVVFMIKLGEIIKPAD